jgi:hypothetical protein
VNGIYRWRKIPPSSNKTQTSKLQDASRSHNTIVATRTRGTGVTNANMLPQLGNGITRPFVPQVYYQPWDADVALIRFCPLPDFEFILGASTGTNQWQTVTQLKDTETGKRLPLWSFVVTNGTDCVSCLPCPPPPREPHKNFIMYMRNGQRNQACYSPRFP